VVEPLISTGELNTSVSEVMADEMLSNAAVAEAFTVTPKVNRRIVGWPVVDGGAEFFVVPTTANVFDPVI